ncbi:MAG: SPASM domain-containing protein [Candidatus Magnetoovum sp. WYHC-5]|nr:SPASM domain-containing protein [Candidatus Magnetoovum sp. WYHC-5]
MCNMLKLSSYTIKLSAQNDEGIYLYSLKNGNVIHIDKIDAQDDNKDNKIEAFFENDEKELLVEMGFLVEDIENERQSVIDLVDNMKIENKEALIAISLTEKCNLSCPHCFFTIKDNLNHISENSIKGIINFIRSSIINNCNTVRIIFYGGEPLINIKALITLAQKIQDISKDVDFVMSIQTNGTLLTPHNVEKLVKAGIKKAVISVDGLLHDQVRFFKNKAGSFNIVIDNIAYICKHELMEIVINSTFAKEDYMLSYSTEYFDILYDKGIAQKIVDYNFFPRLDQGCGYGCKTTDEEWLYKPTVELRDELLKRTIKTHPIIAPSFCGVELDNFFFISPEGTIYKCPLLKDYSIGNVFEGIKTHSHDFQLRNWKYNAECKSCKYLPLCYGGCKAMSISKSNNSKIDCRKLFYGKVLEDLIRQDIMYGI